MQSLTTEQQWDCECEEDYIHMHADTCGMCGCTRDEQPDSRIFEVENWRATVHGAVSDTVINIEGIGNVARKYDLKEFEEYYGQLVSEYDNLDLGYWQDGKYTPAHPEYRWLPLCSKIVESHQYAKIGDLDIDVQTANMLCKVYDNLSVLKNKLKFKHLTLRAAIDLGWSIL